MLADFECGTLKPYYIQEPRGAYDLREAPVPRFDLLDPDKYNRITVQTSRGCPHKCAFCASSIVGTARGLSVAPLVVPCRDITAGTAPASTLPKKKCRRDRYGMTIYLYHTDESVPGRRSSAHPQVIFAVC